MACDEGLVERIRLELKDDFNITEKRMFGGVCFLINGNMLCGVAKDTLMARLGPAAHEAALARRHVRPMDFTGEPMRGYVFIDSEGLAEDRDLRQWLDACLAYVSALPPKAPKVTKPGKPRSETKTR